MKTLFGAVALLALLGTPTLAQTGGPSCMFPLACPGPVPPKPEPLLGTPEEQAPEASAVPAHKPKHQVRKHVLKPKTS